MLTPSLTVDEFVAAFTAALELNGSSLYTNPKGFEVGDLRAPPSGKRVAAGTKTKQARGVKLRFASFKEVSVALDDPRDAGAGAHAVAAITGAAAPAIEPGSDLLVFGTPQETERIVARIRELDVPPDGRIDVQSIVPKGPNQVEAPRLVVDQVLRNLETIATQARIVPAFDGAKPAGFRLFSIARDSIYAALGIRNGDILMRINGLELADVDASFQTYEVLKTANRIELDLRRDGADVRITCDVR
jgi:hypothetical protein